MLANYGQLEAAWINAGGSRSLAPLMAAIALAESGEEIRGVWYANTDATNPNDNHGTQTSWGAWQISNGTHLPPSGDWNTLEGNATLAVQKYESQGLDAWGTYQSGEFRKFLRGGVPPDATLTAAGGPIGAAEGLWHFFTNPAGEVGGVFHVFQDLSSPVFWTRIGKGALGITLAGIGAFFIFHETETFQNAKQAGKRP